MSIVILKFYKIMKLAIFRILNWLEMLTFIKKASSCTSIFHFYQWTYLKYICITVDTKNLRFSMLKSILRIYVKVRHSVTLFFLFPCEYNTSFHILRYTWLTLLKALTILVQLWLWFMILYMIISFIFL